MFTRCAAWSLLGAHRAHRRNRVATRVLRTSGTDWKIAHHGSSEVVGNITGRIVAATLQIVTVRDGGVGQGAVKMDASNTDEEMSDRR